jgi:putative DNA primase/helicase
VSCAKAAARYIGRGLAVVPVPAREKNPNRQGWQDLRIKIDEVPHYFNNGQNIGIHTGEPSGWRVDVDLDVPQARKIAGRFLPPTLTSGRASAPHSHWWYVCPGAEYRIFADLNGETILELRSTGHHTLVWPSIHPSGEEIHWSEGGLEAEQLHAEDLTRACQEAASAALIARLLPPPKDKRSGAGGGRHNLALALAGFLLRRGLDEQTLLNIMRAAWDAAGFAGDELARREAHKDLEALVADTAHKIREGERATGGRTLERLVPGLPRKLADYWGWKGRLDDEGSFNLTDLGNAERLIHRHGRNLRYCWLWGKWLVWDGKRWIKDDSGEVYRLAKETVASIYREAAAAPDDETRKALAKHAMRSESGARIKEMVDLARSDVPVMPEQLDASKDLLNVENGTIDLRTGLLREHQREDLITKTAPVEYDPDARAPLWETFLERVLPGEELRAFVQRACGYSATGDTSEQCIFINHGGGANGKSTFQEALAGALGDYAMRTPTDMLMVKRTGGIPNDVARLKGARFVSASETEEGRRLAESLIKDLTGQDTISARFMRAEWFDFKPTHKLWLSTNHKPEIRGTDNAIWRRIRLIPWSVKIPPTDQDRQLPEKLRSELPGILAWIVQGCLQWRLEGLQPPDEVRRATQEYRVEMDVLAAFLSDCCVRAANEAAYAGELWGAWKRWCEQTGETVGTQKKFGGRLSERGFSNRRDSKTGRKLWVGLSLLPDWEDRAELSLNHPSVSFAGKTRGAEPSEPKSDINTKKYATRGVVCKKGSDGSDGSAENGYEEDFG